MPKTRAAGVYRRTVNSYKNNLCNSVSRHMRTLLLTAIILLGGCATIEDIGQQLLLTVNAEGYQELSEASDWSYSITSVAEVYIDGEKEEVAKWEKIGREVYIKAIDGGVGIFSINPDGSLTHTANIIDRKRQRLSKDKQAIWGKTK